MLRTRTGWLSRMRSIAFPSVLELAGSLIRDADAPEFRPRRLGDPCCPDMSVLLSLDLDIILHVVAKDAFTG